MLKVFRENLKYLSWVLWLVIAVFILFVFVDFGSGVPRGGAPNSAAVTVGDEEITFSDLQRTYQRTQEAYRQAYGDRLTPELIEQLRLPQQVIDQLVSRKLLLAEATAVGVRATDGELQERILTFPAFQNEQGSFVGWEDYDRILASSGFTTEGFEREMRDDLVIEKLRQVVSESVWIPDAEVESAFRAQAEKAKIRFVQLPAALFSDQVELTDDEVAGHFEATREDFRFPERRVVDYLLIDTAQVRAGIALDDTELRSYYDANLTDFQQEEQVRARHILLQVNDDLPEAEAEAQILDIRDEIEGGGDFAAIARERSSDVASAANGGDLGYFRRGDMVPAFESAAFAAQPGTLVGPVRTPFGFHLIQVVDHRPGGSRTFEEVQGQIQARMLAERTATATESRAVELAERLRRESVDSREAMQLIADQTDSTRLATTPAFGRDDLVPEIGRSNPFSDAAFELAVGEVSDPVQTVGGWVVLRLAEIGEPRLPELEEVADAVRESLETQRQLELARGRMDEVAVATSGETRLETIAEALDLKVQEPAEFGRGGTIGALGAQAEITEQALQMEAGDFSGTLEVSGGVVLFEVVERHHFDAGEFAAHRAETFELLRTQRLDQLLGSMLEARRQATEITFSPEVLESFDLQGGVFG